MACLLLIRGASAQHHSVAWPVLDFRQKPDKPWGGSLRSTFGRGEAHNCSAWWQWSGGTRADSARVDWRLAAAWSGWSGLTSESEFLLSARLPLTSRHALRFGLGASHDQLRNPSISPIAQSTIEGPLGPATFRLQIRSPLASRPGHPMQRVSPPFVAMTVTRTHNHGWASCWLAWNCHGFRLAATAWHELSESDASAGVPVALGLRVAGAPWGLELGGVWRIGGRLATNWAGVDAWGGSQFSTVW